MRQLEGLDDYASELEEFVDMFWLPAGWFAVPDHVAIKCANATDFDDTLDEFKEFSERISFIEMDNRRLATAELVSSIAVASLGDVRLVEIMEPRPEKVGKDIVGFEHMEFYYPDFQEVRDILKDRKINFEPQQNPGHAWINIVINSRGQELKLNNKLLNDTVAHEIETGQALILE